jgi:hypothetical protein
VGEQRSILNSSTGTYQLFDPARLPAVNGPYISIASGVTPGAISILGGQTEWSIQYQLATGSYQRLWHYRVAGVQVFNSRVNMGEIGSPRYVDEPLLFIVLERYPFISGTNYINDLPEIWVGITTTQGTLLQVLRDWQYGLNAGATRLITGNGHRVIWQLGVGALQPVPAYYLTTLAATVTETHFTPAQLQAFLASQAALYPPDFLWDSVAPETLDEVAQLPTLEVDAQLADLGVLQVAEGAPAGSVRMVNDEQILDPLDRYQAT